ncbi:MAG: allophanate hydrolase [Pseudomonadota bacterium]
MKIADYFHRYRSGDRLADVIADIRAQVERTRDFNVWIRLLDENELAPYLDRLQSIPMEDRPLWGIPFAIKDNIDLAGIATTAGCPEFSYTPERSAFVVQQLIDAGAIPIGKTNLDQFATGLVGTRSPHGVTRNALDTHLISGGSSSGSAVAVALGQVAFSLGTDTAGSGRVPAAMNRLVGIKPTRGRWSLAGVVPACQTLDCVSLFTNDVRDARTISEVLSHFDRSDPWSRQVVPQGFDVGHTRYGVASQAALAGESCEQDVINRYLNVADRLNATTIDIAPFLEAARLLYEGPWVAERFAAIEDFIRLHRDAMHPVTEEIIGAAETLTAIDSFKAQYQLQALKHVVDQFFADIDVLALPTIPAVYTIEQVLADPVATNSHLGTFTNFVNLLDLCAVAVPIDESPIGITFIAPAGCDEALLDIATNFLSGSQEPSKPRAGEFHLAVCGAHLSGQPLNNDLVTRGAYLVEQSTTAPTYRLYALPDGKRPALVRSDSGQAIEIEIWSIPLHAVGSFLQTVAPPLGLGSVETADGRWVNSFIAEARATDGATDITRYGGWRSYRSG